ncbi:MAG: DUF4235 domain-containing protein [Streptosporangiales bacterium]|nr:DUF4235 domain-containing protein [Streptosporangiales bacterium]
MSGRGEEVGWKLLGGLAAITAGFAARKAVQAAWKMGTGKEPPANPEHPDTTLAEAIGWAMLSGAVMGLARMIATREAAKRWRKATGALPPGLEDIV